MYLAYTHHNVVWRFKASIKISFFFLCIFFFEKKMKKQGPCA